MQGRLKEASHLQEIMASSSFFPKMDPEYQAELESGAFLIFSPGDNTEYREQI